MEKKIKIVMITEAVKGGVYTHTHDLYNVLKKTGKYDVYILYCEKNYDIIPNCFLHEENSHFIRLKYLEKKLGINNIKAISEIKKYLKDINPDIVHCHTSIPGLVGRIAAKQAKIKKIVYSPHAYYFLKFKKNSMKYRIYLTAEKLLAKYCTSYTIATSTGEYKDFKQYKIDDESKCVLIEHGIKEIEENEKAIKELKEKFNIPENDIVVGAMCRIEPQKDPITTLKILEEVVKNNEKVTAIIFGNGSMDNLLREKYQEIEEKYRNKIILAGSTNEPENALMIMDIYLTASLYEGLPYTLLMAIALKKPIIATRVEGNTDGVIDGKNGYLFEKEDFNTASKQILKAIEDNELTKMSEESYKLYKNKFSIELMTKKYVDFY